MVFFTVIGIKATIPESFYYLSYPSKWTREAYRQGLEDGVKGRGNKNHYGSQSRAFKSYEEGFIKGGGVAEKPNQ